MLSAWNQDDRLALQGRLHRSQREGPPESALMRGLQPLGLGSKRDGLFFVPHNYWPEDKSPLLVMFHDAGGQADQMIRLLWDWLDQQNLIVLAPESRRENWDLLLGGFGPDVTFVDQALQQMFTHYRIDPSLVAAVGVGSGAKYALALGLNNPDLFTHVIAYAQEALSIVEKPSQMQVFVAQGEDPIFPPQVMQNAISWFLGGQIQS